MARRRRPREETLAPPPAGPPSRPVAAAVVGAFVVLAASGIALAAAWDPVGPPPARFLAGVHAWAASALLVLAFALVARGYLAGGAGASGRPRAFAALAFVAVLVASFATGTILPWDQQGWESYRHARDGAAAVGVALPQGPDDAPLGAVFWAHVLALPALLALVAAVRGARLRDDARAVAVAARNALLPAALAVAAVLAAAALWPPERGPRPIENLAVSRPEWPFLWLVPLQDAFGTRALLALPAVFLAAAAGVALARPSSRCFRAGVLALLAVVFALLTWRGVA